MKDNKNIKVIDVLPQHESGVRRMVSDAKGLPYCPLHSLEEAKSVSDGVIIFEGDDGGQIYLVCPASLVNCCVETLQQLLEDIDILMWKDMSAARIFYERHSIGSGIVGGMGGGLVTEDLWVHERIRKLQLELNIREVIVGRRARIK
jgi:hypothetical protein